MYSCFKLVNTMAAAFCRYFNLAVHQWNGNDESFTESWYYWSGDLSFWVANTMISLHVCWQTLNTRSACRYAYEVMSWNVLLLWAHRPSLHNLMGFFFLHFFILSLNSISSQYIVRMFYQRGLWRLHRQQWELASHFYADKLHFYSNKNQFWGDSCAVSLSVRMDNGQSTMKMLNQHWPWSSFNVGPTMFETDRKIDPYIFQLFFSLTVKKIFLPTVFFFVFLVLEFWMKLYIILLFFVHYV